MYKKGFMIRMLLWLAATGFTPTIFAQKAKTHVLTADEAKLVKKDAATLFVSTDYKGALPGYKELVKSDPKNVEYNYRLGICYIMTNSNKAEAVAPLEYVIKSKDPKKETWLYLGIAYMNANRFDDASRTLFEFKTFGNVKPPKDLPSVDRLLEMCQNGKDLVSRPVDLTFSNIGKTINTIYDEYNPYISADGKQLIFTTRRKGNIGGFIEDLGVFTADVYWSLWKDTIWTKAKGLGGLINTDWDEECTGISADGNQLVLYFDNAEAFADLGIATLKGKMWQKPLMLTEKVNSKGYEGGACMSLDGSTIIYSSNRKDGQGGADLWMIRKESGGEWGDPVNLGPVINSKYDEESPFLSVDGKTLYYASKGFNSMGGYDIFYSRWNESSEAWSAPVNIGYPLNTADDNSFFSITGDGRFAFISSVRKEGLGERDIYKVSFNDPGHHPFQTVISGIVTAPAGGKPELTRIGLIDKDGKTVIEFKPGYTTNRFILTAQPGTYSLKIEGYHFEPVTETIEITPDNYLVEKNITVTLSK